jgi:hypothetical protein
VRAIPLFGNGRVQLTSIEHLHTSFLLSSLLRHVVGFCCAANPVNYKGFFPACFSST